MLYLRFWDKELREWRLVKINFVEAIIYHFLGEDCYIVPRKNIVYKVVNDD